MNRFKLVRAGINVNEGIERMMGDVDMYERLLASFAKDELYAQLLSALEKKDVEAAFSAAHALKGVAGNLSLSKVYEAVCSVVETLRVKQFPTSEQMDALKEAYEKAMEAVEQMVAS